MAMNFASTISISMNLRCLRLETKTSGVTTGAQLVTSGLKTSSFPTRAGANRKELKHHPALTLEKTIHLTQSSLRRFGDEEFLINSPARSMPSFTKLEAFRNSCEKKKNIRPQIMLEAKNLFVFVVLCHKVQPRQEKEKSRSEGDQTWGEIRPTNQ